SRLNSMPLRRTFNRQQATDGPNPNVANSELLVSGDIAKQTPPPGAPAASASPAPYSGVVFAHGDKTDGYGLYLMDDKMHFRVNQGGKSNEVVTPALPGSFSFKASLLKDGSMRLLINDKSAGTAKAAGLFKSTLDVPVRVGTDHSTGAE